MKPWERYQQQKIDPIELDMPAGTKSKIVDGVQQFILPDGTIRKPNGGAKPWERYQAPVEQPVSEPMPELQEESFLGNVGREVMQTAYGQKPLVTLPSRFAKESASAVGEVVGDVASALTPDVIEEPIKEVVGQVGEYIAGTQPAQRASELYGIVKERAPNVADILEGGAAVGSLVPVGGAAKMAMKKDIIPTADQIREVAGESYARAEKLGGVQGAGFTEELVSFAEKIAPTDPFGKIGRGKTASDAFIEELSSFRGQPMSLKNAEALDKNLTDKIAGTFDVQKGAYSADGKELIKLQSKFRDMMEDPKQKYIEGGNEGFNAYRKGVKQWAAARRMDDIEDIFRRAENSDNPAQTIKSRFAVLANNPKRLRGYTDKEKALINRAAKTGQGTDILRVVGSRLLPLIVGGSGGGLGATAAAAAGSAGARGAAARLQARRGNRVAKEIAKRLKEED